MSTSLRIDVDDLKKRMEHGEDFTIIDVRNPEAWAESDTMIPESIHLRLDELDRNLARIPKSRPVVAYCT
jgi:rhodanese-related sulfurtransferase